MILKSFLFLLIVMSFFSVKAQTIKGTITTIDNKIIETASVIVKDSANAQGIKEFIIAKNGSYEIVFKKSYQTVFIEIAVSNYSKANYTILNPEKGKTYIHDFLLNKDKIIEIAEVKIVAKKKAYIEQNDTISYNVSAYKDGSDRKIQDVIKKMPGMEVNENTGEIKYKGVPVETVQLEGDDLFSGNYTIGTKNINVGMIEQVQALENFSSNKLLKGLERDGKVALNLKLKKNITDFSGSLNSNSGTFNEKKLATDSDFNFLTINSQIKSFGTVSFNNLALNYSPFDYFGNFTNKSDTDNLIFKNKKIIQEANFLNVLDNKRTVLNNSIFGTYNISYKKNAKTSYKSNLYFQKDKITSEIYEENNNKIGNLSFVTTDRTSANKKPLLFRSDFNIKHFLSESSSIDYDLILSKEDIKSKTAIVQNNTQSNQTNLFSENLFIKSKLVFTKRISSKKAFQIQSNQTLDQLNQLFSLFPDSNNSNATYFQQKTDSKKIVFDVQSSLIGKIKKAKYSSNLGFTFSENPLNSELTNLNQPQIILSFNDTKFTKAKTFLNNSFDYDWGFWKISSNLNLSFLNQEIKTNSIHNLRDSNFIVEPDINFNYKFNRISNISFSFGSKTNSLSDKHTLINDVLVSNRIIIKNIPALEFQKNNNIGINYNLFDLSKQFQLNLGLNYSDTKGDFFSNLNINPNNTQIVYFFLNEKSKNLNLNFMIEKYLPFMESTIRFKTTYNVSNYKNFINNSTIRENINNGTNSELFLKSAFDGKMNFQNIFKININKTINSDNLIFQNKNYENAFKILIKANKKLFIDLNYDYYVTNSDAKYSFVDFFIKYIPKNKKYLFSLTANNILNNKNFTETQTSDYFTSIYSSTIIPRTLLLSCNYSF